jgi:hypothetical protein
MKKKVHRDADAPERAPKGDNETSADQPANRRDDKQPYASEVEDYSGKAVKPPDGRRSHAPLVRVKARRSAA